MSDIDVVIADLGRHAGRVEDIGDRVDNARSAAGQVSMQGEAYGMLCSPLLVPILGALEGAGIAAISACASAVDRSAMGLRTMAGNLSVVDEIAARRSEQAGSR